MVDEAHTIDAEDIAVGKLFREKIFSIPNFQRPFSWGKSHFEDLVDDISNSLISNKENYDEMDNYEPYFLGSTILKSEDGIKSEIIDGQQRITSLLILFSVIKDIEHDDDVGDYLFQKGQKYEDIPETPRLEVRENEKKFFDRHIFEEGGTEDALSKNKNELEKPKEKVVEAIEVFEDFFDSDGDRGFNIEEFLKYLLQKVVLVKIETDTLSSAFRLFNVTNARGMPLTNADLLKSDNLSVIDEEERDNYARTWENIEENIGSEDLDKLISFIRHLKLKTKAQKSIYEEFDKQVFEREPEFKGRSFIDYLDEISKTYQDKILEGNLDSGNRKKDTYYHNLIALMTGFFPSDEWMTSLIKFHEEFKDDSALSEFLNRLEKKVAVDWISGLTSTERLTEIYRLIEEIEAADTPDEVLKHKILNGGIKSRKESFLDTLDVENFYRKGNYRMARYVLLRLDLERRDNTDVELSYNDTVTVEHILPQTPNNDYWLTRFDDEAFRMKWTDKLGNLAPLNQRKNYRVQNKPFLDKVEEYFKKKSDFHITNSLDDKYREWTPGLLKKRHKALIEESEDVWFG